MIVTISQGGSKNFEVEKLAGRRRSTEATDNLGVLSGGTASKPLVPAGLGTGPEFLETSLPSKEMLTGSGKAKVVLDKTKVQLSGGEPTLHPDFFAVVEAARRRPIKHLMVNTNGIRLAQDEAFAERLAEHRAGFEVYLQFDSFEAGPLAILKRGP